jgi:N-acylneuraminate cytidylyltransferase
MKVLAVIPARGGSKGIKGKNLVSFKGKPLVVHSIEHALNAKSVDRVLVSTDSELIREVSLKAGAEVPFLRPAHLGEDHILDLPVFEHALNWLSNENYKPDLVVHLRPTTPHRLDNWIDEAVAMLASRPDADSVRSVSPPDMHPYRMFTIDGSGMLDPIMKHEHKVPYLLRRQDLPPIFHYNCVIDVTRPNTIFGQKSMTGNRMLPYLMQADDVIDIDTPRDLIIAETLFGGQS